MKIAQNDQDALDTWIGGSALTAIAAVIFYPIGYVLTMNGNFETGFFVSGLVVPLLLVAIVMMLYVIARALILQFEPPGEKEPPAGEKVEMVECAACGARVGTNERECPACGRKFAPAGKPG